MFSSETLRDRLHGDDLVRKDQILLILAESSDVPKKVVEIRQVAASAGLQAAKKWNISTILGRTNSLAVRVEGGWILTRKGQEYLEKRGLVSKEHKPVRTVGADLRQHLSKVTDPDVKSFLQEAVVCLEAELLRAAVVLSWVGAMALLYDHVVRLHLSTFNAEAKRRDQKWRYASTPDDLARMREHEFLNVLEAISVIGKNVKQELQENCLKLRNACGHPSSLKIGQNRVAAHIEILIQNVFSKI